MTCPFTVRNWRLLRGEMSLLRVLLGRRLANREYQRRKIGVFEGLAAMGLDGLASSAYGPEAALTLLMPLGLAGSLLIGAVMTPILVLLAILYVSYWQTITAYPSNGGAYTVAKENLGTQASLFAAAALMIDYVLNVAVAISAGVAALVSAVPELRPYTLTLCLAILALITIANLRGTLDAGRLFAVPTYVFVATFAVLLTIGSAKSLMAGAAPVPVIPPPALGDPTEAASLWLLLRSFAAGCTAMTGVEAVSNGVSAFREPPVRRAHGTLTAIVLILGMLLAGIAYLVTTYHIGAMDQTQDGYQSVLSQLAAAVVGRGWFYNVAIGSLLCVLALSANTSFTDFPRLCRLVAQDGFLPQSFALMGRRLVYSAGILYLAITAALLLCVFGGITDRLIPLFAIGAFLTFTTSQVGMVAHWWREKRRSPGGRQLVHISINGVGAAATAIATLIIIATKFLDGAWITILVLPAVILLLRSVHRYHETLQAQIRADRPLSVENLRPPIVVLPMHARTRLTDEALRLALSISPDVTVVHYAAAQGPDNPEDKTQLRRQWAQQIETPARRQGIKLPKLLLADAPYRLLHASILQLVQRLHREEPGRVVTVLLPEIVMENWWQYLLHTHRAYRIRSALRKYGEPPLVVMNIPWHLGEPEKSPDLKDLATDPRRKAQVD